MAKNFKIKQQKTNKKTLQLELYGDFDGTSAWELIHILNDTVKFSTITINTTNIGKIYPFGTETLLNYSFSRSKDKRVIIFEGEELKLKP